MAKILIALLAYHALFFRRQYLEPFRNSTGELLSTHFPHWLWIGRRIADLESWFKDEIYYYNSAGIPFLSCFYPLHLVSAFLGSFMTTDNAFKLLHYLILSHYILMSVLAYTMFHQWWSEAVSLFGAITLTYMAASQRIQNPCIAYTMAWIPGCFIEGPIGSLSLGLTILGGYWPVLAYMIPWITLNNPGCLRGIIIGLPQIIPFLLYWPKSIRHKQVFPLSFGKVPLWRFFLHGYRGYINGVLFFESAIGFGLAGILAIFSTSRAWMIVAFSFVMSLGILPVPFRVPARFIYPFSFFAVWMACSGLSNLSLTYESLFLLIVVQGYLLLRNASLYPLWPFTEWQHNPSWWFNKETYDLKKFPYFTGYFHERRTAGYTGGFSLKSVCSRNGVTNPFGERV